MLADKTNYEDKYGDDTWPSERNEAAHFEKAESFVWRAVANDQFNVEAGVPTDSGVEEIMVNAVLMQVRYWIVNDHDPETDPSFEPTPTGAGIGGANYYTSGSDATRLAQAREQANFRLCRDAYLYLREHGMGSPWVTH